MKKRFILTTGMVCGTTLLLAISGGAWAADMNDGNRSSDSMDNSTSGNLSGNQQSDFRRLDADGNSTISRDEAKANSALSHNFSSADTDNNGKIDQGEFAQFESQIENNSELPGSSGQPGASGQPGNPNLPGSPGTMPHNPPGSPSTSGDTIR